MNHFKKLLVQLELLLLLSVWFLACDSGSGQRISYHTPIPDGSVLTFLTGIVSSDSFDFNAAFSPDGRCFYFSRRSNGQSDIFVTTVKNGEWSNAKKTSFSTTEYSEADPAFDNQGKLYFISNRPRYSSDSIRDYDIWYVEDASNGEWSSPRSLDIVSSDSSEFYISFSENGDLYFASARQGGLGEEDVYVSRNVNGNYSAPENLGPVINSAHSEYDPGVSPDGEFLVFASKRDESFGGADLYGSRKEMEWRPAVHLDKKINSGSRDFCPYFSEDGKYFFFSSEGDVKWVDASLVKLQIGYE